MLSALPLDALATIDIDPCELNKNKTAHIPIVSDVKFALDELNKIVEAPDEISGWVQQVRQWKKDNGFRYDTKCDGILQQHAISELSRLTKSRETYLAVGVGQHQMWEAQYYHHDQPRTLITSGAGARR